MNVFDAGQRKGFQDFATKATCSDDQDGRFA